MALRLVEIDASPKKAELLQNFKDNSTVVRAALCHQAPDVLVGVRQSGYLQLTHLSKGTFKVFLAHLDEIPLEVPIRCLEFSPAAYCISRDDVPPIVFSVSHSNLLLLGSFMTGGTMELLAFPSRPSALYCDGDYTLCGDGCGHVALFRHDHDYIPSVAWERDLQCSAISAVCIHTNVAIAAGADYSVSVMDVARGETIASITAEATPTVNIFGFDLPSYCVGVCGSKGAITVWAPTNNALHSWVPVTVESTFPIRTASYHNKFLSVGGIDGRLALYDATEPETGLRQLTGFDLGHSIVLTTVTDDAHVVVVTNCGDVWRWPLADVLSGEEAAALDVPPEPEAVPPPPVPTHHSIASLHAEEAPVPAAENSIPVPSSAVAGAAPHDASHTVELTNVDDDSEPEENAPGAHDVEELPPSPPVAAQRPPPPPLEPPAGSAEGSDAEVIFCDDFSVQTPRETQTVDSNAQYPGSAGISRPTTAGQPSVTGEAPSLVHVPQSTTLSSVGMAPSSVVAGAPVPASLPSDGAKREVAVIPSRIVGGDLAPGHGTVVIPGLKAGRRLDPRAARAALDRYEGLQKSQQYIPPHELASPALQTTTLVEASIHRAENTEYDPQQYAAAHRNEAMALAFQHPIHAVKYKPEDVVFNVVGLTSPPRDPDAEAENENQAKQSGSRKPIDEMMDSTFTKFVRKKDEAYLRQLQHAGPRIEDHHSDELLFPQSQSSVLFAEYKPRVLAPDPLMLPLPLAPTPATF